MTKVSWLGRNTFIIIYNLSLVKLYVKLLLVSSLFCKEITEGYRHDLLDNNNVYVKLKWLFRNINNEYKYKNFKY